LSLLSYLLHLSCIHPVVLVADTHCTAIPGTVDTCKCCVWREKNWTRFVCVEWASACTSVIISQEYFCYISSKNYYNWTMFDLAAADDIVGCF